MNHTAIRRWDIARAEAPVTETFGQFQWQAKQHLDDGWNLAAFGGQHMPECSPSLNSSKALLEEKRCLYFLYSHQNHIPTIREVTKTVLEKPRYPITPQPTGKRQEESPS